jgi:(2Fe-2S) ferredoxin
VNEPRYRIIVCRGPECGDKRGSAALYGELARLIKEKDLQSRVELEWQSCFGRCQSGPNIMVRLRTPADDGPLRFTVLLPMANGEAVLYQGMRIEELARLLDDHVKGGQPVRALLRRSGPR